MATQLLKSLAGWYGHRLESRPIATKSLTACTIAVAGDLACQYLQTRSKAAGPAARDDVRFMSPGASKRRRDEEPSDDARASYHGIRTAQTEGAHVELRSPRADGYGLLPGAASAALSSWDARRTLRMGCYALCITPAVHVWYNALGRAFPASPLMRMLSDQVVWTPVTLALFLVTMGVAEHGTLAAGTAKLSSCFVSVLSSNYAVWPAIQYANLGYVPVKYQILVANVIGLAWAVYLSSVVNQTTSSGGNDTRRDETMAKERGEAAAESSLVKAYARLTQRPQNDSAPFFTPAVRSGDARVAAANVDHVGIAAGLATLPLASEWLRLRSSQGTGPIRTAGAREDYRGSARRQSYQDYLRAYPQWMWPSRGARTQSDVGASAAPGSIRTEL